MPKVSVIVPNYNHAPFLPRRLDTIFSQSFQDFEVILLDDFSTDESVQILQQYSQDSRVRIYLNSRNSGSPFKQWNKGLDLARGEYVWIAESDDYADQLFLEHLVKALEADPEAGIAYSQSWIATTDTMEQPKATITAWYEGLENSDRWQTGYRNSGEHEISHYLVFKNTIPNASAVLFRKAILNDGLRAPENMRLAGDWIFWVKLLLRADVIFDPKPLNYFRAPHPDSQRRSTQKQGLELVEGLQVYSLITQSVALPVETQWRVLRHQVRLWGHFASTRGYSSGTNKDIYGRLTKAHPEIGGHHLKCVLLPFLYFFITGPLRSFLPLRTAVRGLQRITRWTLGKSSKDLPTIR